jgi:acid phosphatase
VGLTTVTPDLEDDMHDGTVAHADHWLAGWVPEILASPAYRSGRLAVLIAWDEGSGAGNVPSHAALVVMSASTPAGTRSPLAFDDYSVLRSVCQLTGAPVPGREPVAPSLVGPFHL